MVTQGQPFGGAGKPHHFPRLLLVGIIGGLLAACSATVPVVQQPTSVPRPTLAPTMVAVAPTAMPQPATPTPHPSPTATVPAPSSSPSVAAVARPSASRAKPPLDMAAAWGGRGLLGSAPMKMDNSHLFVVGTVTPDGRFLVGEHGPRQLYTEASAVGFVDIRDGSFLPIHTMPTSQTQMSSAAADDTWVVWSEASHQPDFADWTLYAYNRHTQEVKQIAQSPLDANGQPTMGALFPKVDHGVAVWDERGTTPAGATTGTVKQADLASGTVTTLTDTGLSPVISWPNVAWVKALDEPEPELQGANKTVVVVHNLETGDERTLHTVRSPSFMNLYKDSLVWLDITFKKLMLTNLDETNQQLVVQAEGTDTLQFPTVNDRLVTWISYNDLKLWDRVQQRVITYNERAANNFVNGPAFFWASYGSQEEFNKDRAAYISPATQTFYVIDTSMLPPESPK